MAQKTLSIRVLGLGALLAVATAALAGCYQPDPSPHALLDIDAKGQYQLNGVAQPADALVQALQGLQAVGGKPVVVVVHASPQTDPQQVRVAVADIEQAHQRVAFADASEH